MSQYDNLKATIAANVYENHENEVTANKVKEAMNAMTDSLGAGYQYLGIATPATTPGTPDYKCFYIAAQPGTYTNFSGLVVNDGEVAILKYDTAWTKEVTGAATAAQVTELGQKVDLIPNYKFADNCPFIREMYINNLGVQDDVAHVHIAQPFQILFSNAAGDAFVAVAYKSDGEGIIPIRRYTDTSIILGYIVVDWSYLDAEWTYQVNAINDIAKNINYSPSIKAFYLSEQVEEISPVQELGYDEGKNVSQKVITENLDAILTELIGSKQESVGTINPPALANNTSFVWFIVPAQRLSKINRIKFLATEGTINFYKVKYDGVNAPTKEDITSVVINSLQHSSVMTIDVDVTLEDDEYIGINGAFWFGEIEGNTTRAWNLSTDAVGVESTQYLFVNAYYEDVNAEIAEIKNKIDDNTNKVVMYSATLDSENADIVGTQQIVDGALRVGSSILYLDKFYSLGIRTSRAICKFNFTTIAEFVTVLYNTHTVGGSSNVITVNLQSRSIQCLNGEVVFCPLLVNYTHDFQIDITKHFQHNIVRVVDLYSGAEWEHVWTFNGTGGVGGGAIGTLHNTGMAWDCYGFYASNGTFDVKKIAVLGKKADVVFYGDSITEPESYWPHNILKKSWTQLLYEKSNGRIISSGRSGTGIYTLLARMQNELPYLKPKAVFITIGTNGGIDYSSMEAIVNYIRSLDIIPYVNHIPANINSGGVSNHAAVNAIVDQIRTQMGVKGIDFDKPTSVNYTGGDVNTATMWWEEYASPDGNIYHHPNELGSAAMVARAEVDIPEIYGI